LEAMNVVWKNGEKLSDLQVKQLYQMFDLDGDGFIDYQEFVHSLEVIDVTKKKLMTHNTTEQSFIEI
jgi:Ca2+-binding EF-hand superfamily protein